MKKAQLKDITINITDGKHGDCNPEKDSGFYFVSCKDIHDGMIDYSNARQIVKEDFIETSKRTRLEPDDILITNSGTIGRMVLVKDIPETSRTTFQKSVAIVKPDKSKVLPSYLYYKLLSSVKELENQSNGAAQKNLLLGTLRNYVVDYPEDINVQKSIADILLTYDKMIDNNTRQIELLEESAKRIYKEWFVNFKFTGNNTKKIPQGWHFDNLASIIHKLESGSRPKGGIDKTLRNGIPSIGAENVIGLGKYNFESEKMITEDFFDNMKKGKITDKDILVYKDGAYIGKTSLFQDGFPHKQLAVNEHVFLLHAKEEIMQYYLFFTLYQHEYYLKMQQLNKNAAQPGINKKALEGLELLIPSQDVLVSFDNLISPMVKTIFLKSKQNKLLLEARDRTLSILMKKKGDEN